MTIKEQVIKAQELGKAAFHAGKKMVPAHDKDLMAIIAGNKVGEGIPVLKAWNEAWSKEHRAKIRAEFQKRFLQS